MSNLCFRMMVIVNARKARHFVLISFHVPKHIKVEYVQAYEICNFGDLIIIPERQNSKYGPDFELFYSNLFLNLYKSDLF